MVYLFTGFKNKIFCGIQNFVLKFYLSKVNAYLTVYLTTLINIGRQKKKNEINACLRLTECHLLYKLHVNKNH